jgi:alkylation response protein AidB-like acyl-CoA dehydrogenase
MTAVNFEITFGMLWAGAAQRALDELVAYAKAEGLIKRGVIRHKLADLTIYVQALQLEDYEMVWNQSKGQDIVVESALRKVFMVEVLEKIGCTGSEILGAHTQTDPNPKAESCAYTRVRTLVGNIYWLTVGLTSGGGTPETLKNTIARFSLKLPRSS